MELLNHLELGFSTALHPSNLLYCFIGVLLGTLVGVLPGLGATVTVALLLPMTFALSPASAMIMLAGIYYGAQYGGSTTAILVNVPGENSSVVTTLDGYQMARNGQAGPALATAAIGSFAAGTVATFFVALFAPMLTKLALLFGPAEYFSLMMLGLVASIALASGSIAKAIAMIVLGLLLGTVGTDVYTGERRFTLGLLSLSDGLSFLALAIGLFGLSEVFRNHEAGAGGAEREILASKIGRILPSRGDMRRIVWPIARGTGLGSILGILPGGGAVLASFAAYALEKKISPNKSQFGSGAIEGVAAPESANNAGAQTSFIPMLTLGIPSNPIMALMIGALIIQGIVPGPNVESKQPELFWGLIASMWIGNLMLLVLNLPLIGIWVKLLKVPPYFMTPSIVVFAVVGVYCAELNMVAVVSISIFGIAGYVLYRLRCEPTPLLLGFVLGPMIEQHFRRAMLLSYGDPSTFVTRPISATFLVLAAMVLILVSLPVIARKRETVFVEDN